MQTNRKSFGTLKKMTVMYRWPLWMSGRYDRFYCTSITPDIMNTKHNIHTYCLQDILSAKSCS